MPIELYGYDMEDENDLIHYGMPRRSGRYPWGSGENPYQRTGDFMSRYQKYKEQGLTEAQIAKAMEMSTTKLRATYQMARHEERAFEVEKARSLREKGYSLRTIAKMMGYKNDSSIRTLLDEDKHARASMAEKTADFLKEQLKEKGLIDVGAGANFEISELAKDLHVSDTKLNVALEMLKADGYKVYNVRLPQATNPGKFTTVSVLADGNTSYKDVYDAGWDNIHSIKDYWSPDGGDTFKPAFVYPKSMDSNRISVRYAEDGGRDLDGTVEIRRGVKDLSLGNAMYSQVRILVDGDKYVKAMAVYGEDKDFPDGVDLIFNSNKPKGTPLEKVLKPIHTEDPDNPFGSAIKKGGQSWYIDDNGNEQMSLINKRADEGDWGEWSKELPSQFLAKQNIALIRRQLNTSLDQRQQEFDEIMSLTNPVVKKKLLYDFADGCDGAAVELKAAALPRQKYQVILPSTTLKDNEVYAPNYNDGEQVMLVRFPHAGTFESPIVTVNNRNEECRKKIGMHPADAVCVNSTVAGTLSGADYDGDSVLVIPCSSSPVKLTSTVPGKNSTSPLAELKHFDPKMEYPPTSTSKRMAKQMVQKEMGSVSNLIMDMTLQNATEDELARAVKHSMVVIDAKKHGLDYKRSEAENGINALKKKYQRHIDPETGEEKGGAATLITRAKSPVHVTKRVGSPQIDKETGELVYKEKADTYIDRKTGKTKENTLEVSLMSITKDPRVLSKGTVQEEAYAEYAASLKNMANSARLEYIHTHEFKRDPGAAKVYAAEVEQLKKDLTKAKMNAPKERQAQRIANAAIKTKTEANPDMDKEEQKKLKSMELAKARAIVGAERYEVPISDKQWEAIQAHAVSASALSEILKYADADRVRDLATPKARITLTPYMRSRLHAMVNNGLTTSQIAEALGISTSTVSSELKGGE